MNGYPLHIRSKWNQAAGRLAALLLVLLPLASISAKPLAERKAYLSSSLRSKSRCFADVQVPVALFSVRSVTHLFSSTAFLPVSSAAVYRIFAHQANLSRYQPIFSLAFLRLLFEHQIAINAP